MTDPHKPFSYLFFFPFLFFLGLIFFLFLDLRSAKKNLDFSNAINVTPAPTKFYQGIDNLYENSIKIEGFNLKKFRGRFVFVHFWSSWCRICRQEFSLLFQLKKNPRLLMVAINYKDSPLSAKSFLSSFGNPFLYLGTDKYGLTSIEWGVYGIPESFLINPDGNIISHIKRPLCINDINKISDILVKYYNDSY